MTDALPPFDFSKCTRGVAACREAIRPLLAKGADWTELSCGRCGAVGRIVHAELVSLAEVIESAAAPPAPEESEAVADFAEEEASPPPATGKGAR